MLLFFLLAMLLLQDPHQVQMAGSASNPNAKLLFKSGFENSVRLAPAAGAYSQYQYIQGADNSTGYVWPATPWSPTPWLTGLLGVITSSYFSPAPEDFNSYIQNAIETVTGPNGNPTYALRQKIAKPSPNTCCTQDSLQLAGLSTPLIDSYVRYWIKLNPEFRSQVQTHKNNFWRVLWEMKTFTDYRIATFIYGNASGQPFFFVHADNSPAGANPYQEYWAVSNTSVPVPLDEWFSVEFYLHRSTGSDGRFYWAVNGQTIADHYGPNYGVRNENVDVLMLSNLYGNSVHLNPAYQWIDDLEVWDLPPCAALPCGAPGGGTSASLGSCPAPAPNVWTGCYYADQNFSKLGMVRTEPYIHFDWGIQSPDAAIPADHFSVRWSGNFTFDPGSYTFTLIVDDGFRLYIDDVKVMDLWAEQAVATYTLTQFITGGAHTVTLEYFENTGNAVAVLHWYAAAN